MGIFENKTGKTDEEEFETQVEQHLAALKSYHIENNIKLPQIYIDLFAKHLAAGNPLEP